MAANGCGSGTHHLGKNHRRTIMARFIGWVFVLAAALATGSAAQEAAPPNIVLIYADDLGFGDVSCNGATEITTPNIDRLAKEGLRFRDAHSAASTCTPSRYAMMTGEYAFRKKGTGILPGDAAMIIEPGRTTMASVLKKAGYTTAVVGKWHLGLTDGKPDWNSEIKPGPLEIGFDYCFLVPATGDRVPCVYLENHRVVGLDPKDPIRVSYKEPVGNEPTGKDHPELLKMHPSHGHDMTIVNGISRIGYMSGGKAARWVDEDMADTITQKAIEFIERSKDKPFFLYFATHDIHVPRVPHPRFVGKSGMGPRGDAILEFDDCAGRILDTLDRLKLKENTLVILSADNGPVVDDGYKDDAWEKLGKHKPSGNLRGAKGSLYEGGTRVPMVVRWPTQIEPGVSDALVCQADFLATFAALTGQKLAPADGPDSFDILPALLGKSKTGRNHLIEHSRALALRQGPWKYIEPSQGPKLSPYTRTELGHDPEPQLYNLKDDLAEQKNLKSAEPAKTQQLGKRLNEIRDAGRSRP